MQNKQLTLLRKKAINVFEMQLSSTAANATRQIGDSCWFI